MHTTKYLIVGAGMTGDMAAKGIREHDSDGSITMIGADPHPTVQAPAAHEGPVAGRARGEALARAGRGRRARHRPPHRLARSRGAHRDRRRRRGVLLGEAPARHRREAARDPGRRGRHLVPHARRLPPPARDRAGGIARRRDRRRLHRLGDRGRPHRQRRRASRCSSPSPGSASASSRSASPQFVAEYYREKGVDVLHRASWSRRPRATGSRPSPAATLEADARRRRARRDPGHRARRGRRARGRATGSSSTSTGACPGTRTSSPPATSRASPSRALGTTMRIEHEDHANTHGKAVGANMAGADTPYDHLPFFYSDLFDLGYEAVGQSSTRGSRRSRTGRSRTARASSPTSRTASRAACCSGTCGTSSTRPAT